MSDQRFKYLLLITGIIVAASCTNEQSLNKRWKISKIVMWDEYGKKSLYMDVSRKSFYVQDDSYNTKQYKDSLFNLLRKCYLKLNKDSTFSLFDKGFFTGALSDTNWFGLVTGNWEFNGKDSAISLNQSNGLNKKYKLIHFSNKMIKIGELFQNFSNPISEITLIN
jgi:hypothetical protein